MPTGASGSFKIGRNLVLGFLDAPLDLADVVQILAQLGAVGCRQVLLQGRHLIHDRIEQAAALLLARQPLGVVAPVAEQFLEHHLRIVLHRQRDGRGLPGNRVRVGAGVTRSAAQRDFFDRQLDRRQRSILPDVLGRDLIDGGADVNRVLLRMHAAQKHRGRTRMIGAGVRSDASRGRMRQVGDDRHAVAEFLERPEDLGELESLAVGGWSPLVHRRAVRHVDAAQPALGGRGGLAERCLRRHHRIEQRQRHRNSHASQQRAARKMLLRDECHRLSPALTRI